MLNIGEIIGFDSIIYGKIVTLEGGDVKKYTIFFGPAFDSSDGIFSFAGI
jgi:hypothetical protein